MLEQLTLRDFKSFECATIPFAPLTLLVGPNASGKSNVLDALRILKGLSLPLPIGEVLEGKPGIWFGVRGGSQEAARIGDDVFRIASRWRLRAPPPPQSPFATAPPLNAVRHELAVMVRPAAMIQSERAEGGDVTSEWAGSGAESEAARRSLLGLSESPAFLHWWTLQQAAAGLRPFNPAPDALRGFHPAAATSIGENGAGLVAELYRLLQREPSRREDLVDWLSELCAPRLVDIDFLEVKETNDVMLILVEDGGRRVTSRSASDGTLRFLALLAALWVERADGILVIEEPDLGLHPSRQGLLAELFETRSSEVQIIGTTHSPALLERLSKEALGDVVAFGRTSPTGATVVSRLSDLADFDALVRSRDVAHLFATGWVERAL